MLKNKYTLSRFLTFVFFAMIGFSHFGLCQQNLGSDQFLKQTIRSSRSLQLENSKRNISLPWIETYEIRTESDEFDLNRQKYSIRFTPTSPGVLKAQSELFSHYQRKLSLIETDYVNSKIEKAYSQWVDIYFNIQKLEVYHKLKDLQKDKLQVYEQMAENEDFNFKFLLEAQRKLNELSIKIHALKIDVDAEIMNAALENEKLVFNNFVTLDDIKFHLINKHEYHEDDLKYHYENELLNKEIELERAEKRKIFDFAQLEYGGPHDEILNERISLGLALKIPVYGKRNLKIEEKKIEQQQLDFQHQVFVRKMNEEITEHYFLLNKKIEVFESIENLLNAEFNANQALASYISKSKGDDPIFLLEVEEENVKVKLERLDRQKEIFDEYLDYLSLTNLMFERPLKNYLERTPTPLEIFSSE